MPAPAVGRLSCLVSLTLLGLASGWSENSRADEPPADAAMIGRDLGRIEFRGETVFAPDDLRKALADDPEFQLLAHPALPREEFLSTISKRLTAGYHRSGFPQPEIAARWEAVENRVVVDITAGKRYRKGGVEIVGATRLSKQMLEDWVLKPRPPEGACPITMEIGGETVTRWVKDGHIIKKPLSPMWTPQKPASFHQPDLDNWRKELLRCCAAQGYFDADVTVHVRTEDDEIAALVVTITVEGEQATLGDIEITGLLRNSQEDVLQFLGLETGMEITETFKAELLRKLFDSGKFLEHNVRFGTLDGTSVPLKISLYENDDAALITEPRSSAEEAACRLAAWFNQLQVAQVDLTIEFQYRHRYFEEDHVWAVDKALPPSPHLYSGRAVVAPSHQSLEAEVRRTSEANGPVRFELAFAADNSGLTLKAPRRGERFTIPRLNHQVVIQVTGTTQHPDFKGNSSLLRFGAGMRSRPVGNLPVAFEVLVSPAFLHRQFCEPGAEFVVEGDRGVLTVPQGRLEMDVKTGRLIELRATHEGDHFVVKTGSAVQQAVEVTDNSKANDLRLASDIVHPGTSVLSFALNCIDPLWLAWDNGPETLPDALARAERGLGVAQRILHADVLSPLDKLLSQYLLWSQKEGVEAEFQIPPSESQYFQIGLKAGDKAAVELLAAESWGRRIARDCFVLLSNQQRPETQEIFQALCKDIQSEKLGPLAAWSAERICTFFVGYSTRYLAWIGLQELKLENVHQDVENLLTPDAPLTEILEKLVGSIAATTDDDWKALVSSLLPAEMHRAALVAGEVCRDFKDHPRGAPSAIVARLYPDVIEPLLRTDLQRMATPPQNEQKEAEQKTEGKSAYDLIEDDKAQLQQYKETGLSLEIPEILKSPMKDE